MVLSWKKIITLVAFRKRNTLPETPGVYFFLGANREILYIGKASSLRDRVKSYYSKDIAETRGPKIRRMLEQVGSIAYRETDSVLEALILEAGLIKTHQPPYNTDAKDDKSYQHVVITREKFPRVLIVRGRDLSWKIQEYDSIFGPFPSGGALREALKIIRKLFPFRDRCRPFEANFQEKKKIPPACFSAQIGLCPGVCTGAISAREYQRIIRHIRLFFEGRKSLLIKKLEREMQMAAKQLNFEKASAIKKTLFALRHIQDVMLLKDDWQLGARDQQQTMRIEAYDAAHLGGDASVGVMTVLEDGRPMKDAYRKFILRGKHNGNDLTALTEILTRRLKHNEWPLPDIIVIDGAEAQVGVAKQSLLDSGTDSSSRVAVIGVVKNAKHQPERLIGDASIIKRCKKEILLANSEAHRFAIAFHRKRRGKEFLEL